MNAITILRERLIGLESFELLERVPNAVFGSLIISILLMLYFAAYAISIKSIFDGFPSLGRLLGGGFVELVIIIGVIAAISGIASYFSDWNLAELFPSTPEMAASRFFIMIAIAINIAMLLLKWSVVKYMIESEISILQAVSVAVMHAFYIYFIPLLVMLVILLTKSPIKEPL